MTAERALLATLGGGCQVPIGGYAVIERRVDSFARDRRVARRIADCSRGTHGRGCRFDWAKRSAASFWTGAPRRFSQSLRRMKVYLVGAGPGDPGLITVKGRKILERADAILYDHLASERLLDLAPASAERIYVGKKRSAHECRRKKSRRC